MRARASARARFFGKEVCMPPFLFWTLFALFAVAAAGIAVWFFLIRPRRKLPYERNPRFFTPAEKKFYLRLRRELDDDLLLFGKVRIADVLRVKEGTKKFLSHFSKIAQKHVDFVIADEALDVLVAVELDDSTHEQKDRQKRDRFVNRAFSSAQVPLIHVVLKKSYDDADFYEIREAVRQARSDLH